MKVRLGVLHERTFRSLYFARALSLLGDGVVPLALAFAVLSLDRSATALGVVLTASAIPRVGLLLVGGVVGDRVSRRNVMLATDLLRFGSQASAAFLLISGHAQLWHLALLAFVNGCGTAFFMPASTGLLPQVVPEERLQEANALFSLSEHVLTWRPGARGGPRHHGRAGLGLRRGRRHLPRQRSLPRADP